MNVDELALTKLLVYGTATPGADPNTHIRQDAPPSAAEPQPSVTYSMTDYMTTGAGRYALASEAPLIREFFFDGVAFPTLGDGTYTAADVRRLLGLSAADGSLRFDLSQYTLDAGSDDFIERAYVFGSTSFAVAEAGLVFRVSGGTYSVENVEVRAFDDNFDFQSSNPIATTANAFLNAALDPYGLIPSVGGVTTPVNLLYRGTGRVDAVYTGSEYLADRATMAVLANPVVQAPIAAAAFSAALGGLATNTGYLGAINADPLFRYYTADGKKIVYGTPGNDSLTPLSAEVTADVYFNYQMVGGTGNDSLTGGNFADDLWGGAGDDTLSGGYLPLGSLDGSDKAFYRGAFADYDILFQPDGTVRIEDADAARDGNDNLSNVEYAAFSDRTVSLKPGQDIAFVVDTTGSMWDDIGAVKSSATAIIEAIFDPARDLLNSRVAVVEYNDPFTGVVLPFTDQPDPDDRKSAALSGINALYASGGGDLPELTYTGLLRALDGSAGDWRSDAVSRKIVLFGDATAKDAYLAPIVYALALGRGVELDMAPAALLALDGPALEEQLGLRITDEALAPGLTMTTLVGVAGSATTVPVQIFTVAIGSYGPALDEFEAIAEATHGAAFNALSASQLVDALLSVINLPIYSITVSTPSVDEGSTGTRTVEFTLQRDQGDVAAVVNLARDGTADGDDVLGVPTSVAFAAGELQKTFSVSIVGDTVREADETLRLAITSVTVPATFGGTGATLSILDDDAFNLVAGTAGRDVLQGTAAADLLRSLGGSFELLTGAAGADRFVFGAELRNGVRERDTITDYEVGVDAIVLEDGATVAAIRASATGAVVFLDGDGDALYVNGAGVTPDNLTLIGLPAGETFLG